MKGNCSIHLLKRAQKVKGKEGRKEDCFPGSNHLPLLQLWSKEREKEDLNIIIHSICTVKAEVSFHSFFTVSMIDKDLSINIS